MRNCVSFIHIEEMSVQQIDNLSSFFFSFIFFFFFLGDGSPRFALDCPVFREQCVIHGAQLGMLLLSLEISVQLHN